MYNNDYEYVLRKVVTLNNDHYKANATEMKGILNQIFINDLIIYMTSIIFL